MKPTLTFVLPLLFIAFLLPACTRDFSVEPQTIELRSLSANERALVQAGEGFGFELLKTLSAKGDENVFISPLSVSMALGMAANGANGQTWDEMKSTLGFDGMNRDEINAAYQSFIKLLTTMDSVVIMEIANSIWFDQQRVTVKTNFIDVNKTFFNAAIRTENFSDPATVSMINQWVSDKTHEKITSIINQLSAEEVMVLLNALYFKGAWTYEFDPEDTRDDVFRVTPEQQVDIEMMQQTNEKFEYFENDEMQLITLPYGRGQFAMTVALPKPQRSLDALIESLTPATWSTWMNQSRKQQGTLQMPKFKLEYKALLNETLQAMGIRSAFSGQADFTGITEEVPLAISRVIHKTFVKVDEEGTEAAAVTAVGMEATSVGPGGSGFLMRVDRPFVVVLHEKHTNAQLFMGKIINPAE